jgi:hypothetical protein
VAVHCNVHQTRQQIRPLAHRDKVIRIAEAGVIEAIVVVEIQYPNRRGTLNANI